MFEILHSISNFSKAAKGHSVRRWMFMKLEGVVGTGWSWLGIGKGGGQL
jgi:hypothetical protein